MPLHLSNEAQYVCAYFMGFDQKLLSCHPLKGSESNVLDALFILELLFLLLFVFLFGSCSVMQYL